MECFKGRWETQGRGRSHFLASRELREEAGCCRLDAFRGNRFWRELIWGESREGMHLNSQSTGVDFLSREYWFPWQQKSPASKVLTGRPGLAWDAPDNYLRPRLHCPACPSSELGESGVKVPALQKNYSRSSPSLPHASACASGYSSLDS